jgi:hypothetical protein
VRATHGKLRATELAGGGRGDRNSRSRLSPREPELSPTIAARTPDPLWLRSHMGGNSDGLAALRVFSFGTADGPVCHGGGLRSRMISLNLDHGARHLSGSPRLVWRTRSTSGVPVRIQLPRPVDGFRLGRANSARPLRIGSPNRIVALCRRSTNS